ncbi:MAG: hypothetical protein INQ03_11645 [Candidatus Heimdallarchaeota archaeon]|nr:hypothetical protein [Candidatus Heimdallarchaeota archaeon]
MNREDMRRTILPLLGNLIAVISVNITAYLSIRYAAILFSNNFQHTDVTNIWIYLLIYFPIIGLIISLLIEERDHVRSSHILWLQLYYILTQGILLLYYVYLGEFSLAIGLGSYFTQLMGGLIVWYKLINNYRSTNQVNYKLMVMYMMFNVLQLLSILAVESADNSVFVLALLNQIFIFIAFLLEGAFLAFAFHFNIRVFVEFLVLSLLLKQGLKQWNMDLDEVDSFVTQLALVPVESIVFKYKDYSRVASENPIREYFFLDYRSAGIKLWELKSAMDGFREDPIEIQIHFQDGEFIQFSMVLDSQFLTSLSKEDENILSLIVVRFIEMQAINRLRLKRTALPDHLAISLIKSFHRGEIEEYKIHHLQQLIEQEIRATTSEVDLIKLMDESHVEFTDGYVINLNDVVAAVPPQTRKEDKRAVTGIVKGINPLDGELIVRTKENETLHLSLLDIKKLSDIEKRKIYQDLIS